MTTIAVTGASGTLGRLVLSELAGRDDVVAITRDPAKLADAGVPVRRGDFADPGSLPAALEGVQRLLLISTDVVGERLDGHRAAIDAATAAGVRHIAYTSVLGATDANPAFVAPDHVATETLLRDSGLGWTALRNSIYAEMLAGDAQAAAATGTHATNFGDGAISYVARADCAAAAAAVLTQDGHAGRAYDVTGPEALGADALARLFGELAGREVRVAQVDDEAWAAGVSEQAGLPQPVAEGLATIGAAARGGHLAAVSTAVADLTGRPPRGAREVLEPLLG